MIALLRQRLVGKFAALFAIAGLVVAIFSFVTLRQILEPTFSAIEQQGNREQVARARNALDGINAGLRASALDYAVWDDMFGFARAPTKAFEEEIFTPLGYENLGVDYMAVIRFDGSAAWSQADNSEGTAFLASETALLTPMMKSGSFAAAARNSEHSRTYVRGKRGVYAVQSTWIKKTDGAGQPFAYLVMGQLLDQATLTNALQVESQLDLAIAPQLKREILRSADKVRIEFEPGAIRNTLGLIGHDGDLLATVSFTTPRTVSQTGARALRAAMTAMGLGLLILTVLLALGINRIAVKRLQELRSHVASFRTGRRVIAPDLITGKDEIGDLARQFNQLAEELADAEDELRRSSYVQGKADSAVGLLHNVRNALVPLQVKYDKWQQEDRQPLRSQLIQALDELGSEDCPEQRRTPLESFARTASRRLAELGTTRSEEIIDIKHSVDQILAILSDYHYDSSAKPILEAVNVEALLRREAANLEIADGAPIALIMHDPIPLVRANQIHLQQILTNVLINAIEAMKSVKSGDRVLDVTCVTNSATGLAEIAISDNGEGAAPEVLAHAFERGFSTRKDKSSGMGLHWSSNTMRAMEGELSLNSRGPGQGATVYLTLPLALQAIPEIVTDLAA